MVLAQASQMKKECGLTERRPLRPQRRRRPARLDEADSSPQIEEA
jgi:hypothetical protein